MKIFRLQPLFTLLFIGISIFPIAAQTTSGQATKRAKTNSSTSKHRQCISPAAKAKMDAEIEKTRAYLVRKGILAPKSQRRKAAPLKFIWPLRQAAKFNDPGYYVIDAGVDHNPATNAIKDYMGEMRTYDGHQGVDIGLYPFSIHKIDSNHAEVIAAETGVIVIKNDGFNDRNCPNTVITDEGNEIVLEHADGSRTCYAHLKKNSLTTLGIGATVQKGAFLGIVASSGNSSAPHLHFGVEDPDGKIIDPFAGPCNTLNGMTSWWLDQKPYWETRINKVMSNEVDGIQEMACPTPANQNLKNQFEPMGRVWLTTFIVHQQPNTTLNWKVYGPDNSLFTSKNTSLTTFEVEKFHEFEFVANNQEGLWRVEVTLGSQTESHNFVVGDISACPPILNLVENPSKDSVYQAADTLFSNSVISNNLTISYEAGKAIVLNAGFSAGGGTTFLATIKSCTNASFVDEIALSEKLRLTSDNPLAAELQVFPNPFKTSATIQYVLPQATTIQLSLYDVNGKLATTILPKTVVAAGIQQIDWTKTQGLSGIYFLVLTSSDNQLVKRVVLQP